MSQDETPGSPDATDAPKVAIACQGGGSHTAFTAGVLDRLLAETDVEFDVVGVSGTSGGAICAFATWFGLASEATDADGRARARRTLDEIWDAIKARGAFDAFVNAVGVNVVRAQGTGMPLPSFSPYDTPGSDWGRDVLESTLRDAIDPGELADVLVTDDEKPRLDVGAVDVQRGSFRSFTERTVSYDAILASAAVPNLFQAAPVEQPDGSTRYYWDGLFSQNPPLGNLFRRTSGRMERANELWIVQINPQREYEIPTDLEGIADRRNELGGNLSVNQELEFIRLLNEWDARGYLEGVYEPIEVKTINLEEGVVSPDDPFDYATKVDRDPEFIELLQEHGRAQAERFLATERDRRRVRDVVESAWTADRETRTSEFHAPSFRAHVPMSLAKFRAYLEDEPLDRPGRLDVDDVVEFRANIREALPDLEVHVEELVAERDAVATRWRGTGTHTGTLLDIEPTGEAVTLSGMRIDHLEDGQLVETWLFLEQWSMLRQFDVLDREGPVSTASRVSATPVVTQLSAPAENEELVRTLVDEVWNEGNREALGFLEDDAAVLYLDSDADLVGRDAYWEFVSRYREAFPDLEVTIEDVVSEGDKIALRLRLRGTHRGEIFGVEPTENHVDVARMAIYHVDDGRIVETGIVEDTLGLLEQVGATA
jgi:NTE family protein